MLNLLALETDMAKPNTMTDTIRWLFGAIDKAFYGILAVLYRVFFNVTTLDLFGENIMRFFGRVQIIIGVYMMFQLAMTIMKGIIDPENFTKTEGGAKGIIPRVMISLFMLVLLVPTRTDGSNEFEMQINNQGLLFGTLNSLQYRLIKNNTIGKLILGLDDDGVNYINPDEDDESQLIASSNMFASAVLKGFYRINLIPESERDPKDNPDDKPPEQINNYRMCKNMTDEAKDKYTRLDADPSDIIDLVNTTCSNDGKKYMFTQVPIISFITAIVFGVVLLSFTIDVTVRSVKLAMLRLLAPIPIISYMDPKGSKDGAFNSWVKTLTTTYLDLFVRLATIYFVLYIIQDMIMSGLSIRSVSGTVGVISYILVFIGLFAFAWQAPKFVRELLGMKGEGGAGFFSGFGAIGQAVGLASIPLGAIGSFNASRQASYAADVANGHNERSLINRAKHIAAGIGGGAMGIATGSKAYFGAKDHQASAVWNALGKRNSSVLSAGRDGGTLFGALATEAGRLVTGQSWTDRMEARWKGQESIIKNDEAQLKPLQSKQTHMQGIIKRVNSAADDSSKTSGTYTNSLGQTFTGNYRLYHSAFTAAQSGSGVQTEYVDSAGRSISASDYNSLSAGDQALYRQNDYFMFDGQKVDMAYAGDVDLGLRDENRENFYQQALANPNFDATVSREVTALGGASALPSTYGGKTGLKAQTGEISGEIADRSDSISSRRAEISENRSGPEAQRHAADSKRFGDGK